VQTAQEFEQTNVPATPASSASSLKASENDIARENVCLIRIFSGIEFLNYLFSAQKNPKINQDCFGQWR